MELHCDMAPRTCENFIALAGMGYYDGTIFHRSIRNFMIQVGGGALVPYCRPQTAAHAGTHPAWSLLQGFAAGV